jgi:hypothetical protein
VAVATLSEGRYKYIINNKMLIKISPLFYTIAAEILDEL